MPSLPILLAALLVPVLIALVVVLDRLWRKLQDAQRALVRLKADNKELHRQLVRQKDETAARSRELDAARQALLARSSTATPATPAHDDFDRTVVLRPDLVL